MKLAFCGNFGFFAVSFGFLKIMFLGTKGELVYCCRRQKYFFFGKSKALDGFLEGFSRTKVEQVYCCGGQKIFSGTSSLEQFLRANIYRNLIIYCSGFLSKSDNVCPQKVAVYQDFSGFI